MREPGASPGRSRRCEGSCSPTETPLAPREPGRRWEREPRVRRPAASSIPNPSRKEDSWHDVRSFSWPFSVSLSCSPLRLSARPSRCASKERPRRSSARCPSRSTPRTRSRRSTSPARSASSTTGSRNRRSALRQPDRQVPRRRLGRVGVQGQRRLAAGRRRPGGAEGRRLGALVLRHLRRHRRAADAVARRRRPRTATRSRRSMTPASRRPAPAPSCTSTDGGSRPPPTGRACVGKHVGLGPGLRRRRRPVERREVSLGRASAALLLVALALARAAAGRGRRRPTARRALGHARPRQRGARRQRRCRPGRRCCGRSGRRRRWRRATAVASSSRSTASREALRRHEDWFWFVNGLAGDRSATSYRLRDGDVAWWDYRDWSDDARRSRSSPARSRSRSCTGYDGKVRPAAVRYAPGLRDGAERVARGSAPTTSRRVGTPVAAAANLFELATARRT